jgi:NhaA family Na+:H+ antiporter
MKKSDYFYNLETIGGILLFIAAVLSIIVANSPYRIGYEDFLNISGNVSVGSLSIKKPLILWINDGLMAVSHIPQQNHE